MMTGTVAAWRRRSAQTRVGEKGFTLIELAFAMATGAIVLASVHIVTSSVSSSSVKLVTGLESIRGSLEAVVKVRADIARCRVISVAQDGSSITYSLPIVPAEGTSILDEEGEIRWGISDRKGIRTGGFGRIEFLPERIRDEQGEDQDLNQDGDKADIFEEGRLRRTTDADDDLGLKRVRLLLVRGDRSADVDGDGLPDPIFSLAGNDVVVMQLPHLLDDGGVRVRTTKMRPIECEVPR
jgi:hypothetical protein